ncbi:hypothetical protein OAO42_00005, partial [Candidatus Izimaplasma bacterium]|nr:hypothetical protein [Candidatus Izimaplasma bacterium]
LTFLIILIPTSIYDFYADPAVNDLGGSYYFWKFLPSEKDLVARITAWGFFVLHFLVSVYLLKKLKDNPKEKGQTLSKYNYYLLFANLFFIILHFVHTWIWYDALATDTPVWSSQGSVIVMLILILIMENGRRGLFFGKKAKLPKESVKFIMKNHGIYIVLATTFTFWFHPMEFTWGHLFGFFYMFLLFIQMSLARTKMHNNIYWKFALEITVLFHGSLIALDTQNAPWAMFLFGFAIVFFVTQIYGLKLNKRLIMVSQMLFVLITLFTYSGLVGSRTWVDINEVFRIPVIDYILVFVFVYVIYVPFFIQKRKQSKEAKEIKDKQV